MAKATNKEPKTQDAVTPITVGCAGFPVPATRYFKEFSFVEVQETHVAQPGTGTIRRWKREAPAGFVFSLLAPRDIGQEGYREGKVTESALKSLTDVAKELEANIAIFVAPPEFASNRANKAVLKTFLQSVRKKFGRIVWEPPPTWDPDDAAAIAEEGGATAARDPLHHGAQEGAFGYYRLPGPAGHKSRYEDPAIEKIAKVAAEATHKEAIYVFTNVDMFADAKRLRKALKI
jgi:uncharacterized protein YecE (DUF72 family)